MSDSPELVSGSPRAASVLRIERATTEVFREDWRLVHNLIIPNDPLSGAQVRERAGRNQLDVAYVGDTLVGCLTVRPPAAQATPSMPPAVTPVATVIARILPESRRRGYGERLYLHGIEAARALGVAEIETIVLSSNPDGLRFAESHGFVETERYVLPGADIPYVTLRRAIPEAGSPRNLAPPTGQRHDVGGENDSQVR